MKWTEYIAMPFGHEHANRFWQCKIDDTHFANIYKYKKQKSILTGYDLEIQINDKKSIVGQTINVLAFSYHGIKFNFKRFEKDAKNIIKALTT